VDEKTGLALVLFITLPAWLGEFWGGFCD